MDSPTLVDIERQVLLLPAAQQLELAAHLIKLAQLRMSQTLSSREIRWDEYRGILQHGPDPLEYQKESRAEWDREIYASFGKESIPSK